MNINPLSVLGAYLRGVKGVKKGEKGQAYQPVAGSDHVEISGLADNVGHLSEIVTVQPDVRAERVTEVEEKIASGQHHPTDKEMAESLVKSTVMDKIL
jgi:anti-sigma28 factor (negative regulator of flagellin synthesis)